MLNNFAFWFSIFICTSAYSFSCAQEALELNSVLTDKFESNLQSPVKSIADPGVLYHKRLLEIIAEAPSDKTLVTTNQCITEIYKQLEVKILESLVPKPKQEADKPSADKPSTDEEADELEANLVKEIAVEDNSANEDQEELGLPTKQVEGADGPAQADPEVKAKNAVDPKLPPELTPSEIVRQQIENGNWDRVLGQLISEKDRCSVDEPNENWVKLENEEKELLLILAKVRQRENALGGSFDLTSYSDWQLNQKVLALLPKILDGKKKTKYPAYKAKIESKISGLDSMRKKIVWALGQLEEVFNVSGSGTATRNAICQGAVDAYSTRAGCDDWLALEFIGRLTKFAQSHVATHASKNKELGTARKVVFLDSCGCAIPATKSQLTVLCEETPQMAKLRSLATEATNLLKKDAHSANADIAKAAMGSLFALVSRLDTNCFAKEWDDIFETLNGTLGSTTEDEIANILVGYLYDLALPVKLGANKNRLRPKSGDVPLIVKTVGGLAEKKYDIVSV